MTGPTNLLRFLGAVGLALAVLVLGFAAPAVADEPPAPVRAGGPAPLTGLDQPGVVPGRYIVVLDRGAAADAASGAERLATTRGGAIRERFTSAVHGFAADLSAAAVEDLRRTPGVAYIEADATITALDTQTGAPWGLDRIDQRNLPLDTTFTTSTNGAGVTAYVVDTGIRATHTQFGGRATVGVDTVGDGRNGEDCNGHGTHVAGVLGGATYGVAEAVSIVAVRVLDCSGSGSTSGVIAGIDWVTAHHQAGRPAVANMSLGGSTSTALDDAVRASIADGITYAIAAGNENYYACYQSPGRTAEAITVGASTASDARATYSNYGPCVDLFAPGSNITSAWLGSDTATSTLNGTSMATPHVAGAAALHLQAHPAATPQAVHDHLVGTATRDVLTGVGPSSPNRLLSTLGAVDTPPPPPPAPTCDVERYTGTLSGRLDTDIHPNGGSFRAAAGIHRGCLAGPSKSNFDLELYRWNGTAWARVASSRGFGSTETVTFEGVAGDYQWRVTSSMGGGSYTLRFARP